MIQPGASTGTTIGKLFIAFVLTPSICMFLLHGCATIDYLPQQETTHSVQTAASFQKLDVHFAITPQEVVEKMLEMAQVSHNDVVYDLGCGDGRIVVTAAKKYGCRGIGFDIDPERVSESMENVRKNHVENLVRIEQRDIFTLDMREATIVMMYLLPTLNVKLIPQLEKCRPGTRIVSHDFDMQGIVMPQKTITVYSHNMEHPLHLWITPLKKM